MTINYKLSKLVINNFRGINHLEVNLLDKSVSVLIGGNNAGKSTVLNAFALALNAGGSHQWNFSDRDFFVDKDGARASEFLVQVYFAANAENGLPAVQGVGKPIPIHGSQVKGKIQKTGRIVVSKSLFGADGKAVTFSKSTPIAKAEKEKWADHGLGYRPTNAKLGDIYDHTPEVWFFTPQNVEAALYIWKTGPLAKLAKLLAEKFLNEKWEFETPGGQIRPMPQTLESAYNFFQSAVVAFPFWANDMKPKIEGVFEKYVGTHAQVDLKPDIQSIEEWLGQQLQVHLATDPNSATTPLKDMGDGWQSLIRLAALEALTEYPELVRERIVLLLEEPETHLHPHLKRKLRSVLGRLASQGWTVLISTHASELVSFEEQQSITRLVRENGKINASTVVTSGIASPAKLQSKIDDNGAHDFLFGSAAIFCEGKDDRFAIRMGLENESADIDARSVSVTQCGSVTAIPAFAEIAARLGIAWCAVSDEDKQQDGTIKPVTQTARTSIDGYKTANDIQVMWPVDLEQCFGVTNGKATPTVVQPLLAHNDWATNHSDFKSSIDQIRKWLS